MKTGKTSAAVLGLVGGLVLGAWIGGEMTSMSGDVAANSTPAVTTPAVEDTAAPVLPAKAKRVRASARVASAAPAAVEPATAPKLVMTIPMSAPELHERMRPVMARGTKLPIAIEGFTSAEQFATLAHAARNTQVPFILLKHRVLTEGQSLEEAILASKPDIDAKTEALKAKGEARADILSLTTVSAASNN